MSLVTATALALAITLFVSVLPFQKAVQAASPGDVVSLGGSVTEIVYALGQQDRLAARDTTSSYPPEAEGLPDVGYVRALSAEGVLSVNPALILSEDGAGPPEVIEVLKRAGVRFEQLEPAMDGEGIAAKIRAVGRALEVLDAAEDLAGQVEADMRRVTGSAAKLAGDAPKRVLFILSTQGGRIMASGTGTQADAMIRLAGGVNAIDGVEGYKPLSDEAVSTAAPDVILMMDRGGDHSVADDVLFAMPAIRPTPAAVSESVVRMNGLYLLGFGPRTPDAVAELSAALYGDP
ncbi:ABC transporter substrate-binding protein [Roseovarius sp. LXJ103]|uniref:heme/hemin ABC transporter substrate-binding protein n=1 Tax=Roseovarius carneus TaxID=2853164 RepID=UPI000D609B56|nr:ABC transporter substrate-binding protein [Roseovarius carneus]MBZ8119764.1 ABC transporter substrate-binding protein [Roseovarius carneus]PWE37140.1 hemin ABC transporter substrate-binding protein [Pelagicola sp. LXJ1103]